MIEKVILCWSGGKDSALALHEVLRDRQYEILALLTTITGDYDRVSMHGVRRTLLEKQAKSLNLPLEIVPIPKDCPNEEYQEKMASTLGKFQEAGISSAIFGDIHLEDVRKYREDNLSRVGLKGLFPLWKRDSIQLARRFIDSGFRAIVTCADSRVLDKSFVGRVIDEGFLAGLPANVDPNGENGEFHSFVFDGPIFKEKIPFTKGEVVIRDSFYFLDLLPI